ncbi:hypothetical protein [Microbacterium sp.]|jgi:DNA gyrase/topoisomerase IV subunit A|uniref:hypothetical protein n=1 Tax=Microbacterium sp. TaxID=51671 RepID=UPI0026042993|nr:hypothetical protein [Microbacterium sp.]
MSELQELLGKRQMLTAMVLAAEHRETVMNICATIDGEASDVMQALVSELGVDEFQAQVILDMQLKKFTPAAVAVVRSELDIVDARLNSHEMRSRGSGRDS